MADILPVLWKWNKHILGAVIGTMIITSAVVLLQPNYYEATASFYPVGQTLLQPTQQGMDRNVNYFGDDHDVDRLLAIATSLDLANTIISQHSLAEHYQIDTSTSKGRAKLRKKFGKLYSVIKTKYDGIRINVEDKTPKKAADVANGVLQAVDESATRIIRNAQHNILVATSQSVNEKSRLIDSIVQRTTYLRNKYRVYDTDSQGEALATLESRNPGSKAVQKKISDYTQGVSEIKKLESEREELSKLIVSDDYKRTQILAAMKAEQSSIHVIEKAAVPDEKSRPRRTLIVLAAGLLTLFVSSTIALFIESLDRRPKQSIT